MIRRLLGLSALFFGICGGVANATTVFTLQLVDSQTAVLTATGTLDVSLSAGDKLNFLGASSTVGDSGFDGLSGDFAFGGTQPHAAYIFFGGQELVLEFTSGVASGAVPTGSSRSRRNVSAT